MSRAAAIRIDEENTIFPFASVFCHNSSIIRVAFTSLHQQHRSLLIDYNGVKAILALPAKLILLLSVIAFGTAEQQEESGHGAPAQHLMRAHGATVSLHRPASRHRELVKGCKGACVNALGTCEADCRDTLKGRDSRLKKKTCLATCKDQKHQCRYGCYISKCGRSCRKACLQKTRVGAGVSQCENKNYRASTKEKGDLMKARCKLGVRRRKERQVDACFRKAIKPSCPCSAWPIWRENFSKFSFACYIYSKGEGVIVDIFPGGIIGVLEEEDGRLTCGSNPNDGRSSEVVISAKERSACEAFLFGSVKSAGGTCEVREQG